MRLWCRRLPVWLLLVPLGCAADDAPGRDVAGEGSFRSIVIQPASMTLAAGDTIRLTARCVDPVQAPVPCPALSWEPAGGTLMPASTANDTVRLFTAGQAPGVYRLAAHAGSTTQAALLTIAASGAVPNVRVDSTRSFQTFTGWEVTPSSGWGASQAAFDALADQAVELGITRVRLEATGNKIESLTPQAGDCGGPTPSYIGTNDNGDPHSTNPAGFTWYCFDRHVTNVVLPIKQRVEARGERFWLNVCYVGFAPSSAFQQTDPAEYAELVVTVLTHLKSRFGLEPDTWEARLEPENGYEISGIQIGRLIAAAAAAAHAAGFTRLRFTAPSVTHASNAVRYYNELVSVPGVRPHLAELNYHRYGVQPSQAILAGIAATAARDGIQTAMLEYLGGDEHTLYADLTVANVSAWAKYVLAGPVAGFDKGNQLFWADVTRDRFLMREKTWFLRQYFRAIRPGAVRVGAQSTSREIRPVAFRLADGRFAVVANAAGAVTLHLAGLPAGTYQVSFATPGFLNAEGAPITIAPGAVLSTSMPGAGTISVVASPPGRT